MSDSRFTGCCGLITGGSSGIGYATARLLAARGMRLALVGRRREPLDSAAQSLAGSGHLSISGDIGDPDFAWSLPEHAHERFGQLDLVINNAGYAPLEPLGKIEPETVQRCFQVNSIGPALVIEQAVRIFRTQSERSVLPCIINISTMGTLDPFGGFFAYAASKSAVNSMTRSIANECSSPPVRSFTIAPGAVETPMLRGLFDESMVPQEFALSANDVSELAMACWGGSRNEDNGKTLFISKGETGVEIQVAEHP